MKTMMKQMKTLAALLVAGVAMTACSSDDEMNGPKTSGERTYTMTVEALKGSDGTRSLADGGSTLTATWATSENVYVKNGETWATGSLKPQADGATATLKGTLSEITINAGNNLTLQFPKSGDITYVGQKGTLADIAANFDWAKATIEVASVEDGNITPKAAASFVHQQAVVKFTLQDKGNSNAAISSSALTINDGSNDIMSLTDIPNATYNTNGAGVLYVALPAVSSKPITLTATVGSDTYTLTTSGNKSFANGSYYRVTAQMAKQAAAPAGAEAVNLGLSVKWASMNVGAEKESDYGDYFAWGETEPYYSSQSPLMWKDGKTNGYADNWSSYKFGSSGSFTKYTGSDSKPKLEAADDAARANWGSGWRMPTYTELKELADTKSNTTDYTWLWTTVGGHNGWKITSKKSGTLGNSIFLPAAGDRSGKTLFDQGSRGYYWSSTLYEGNPRNAWYLNFYSGGASMYYSGRSVGFSVRPVQP